MEKFKAPNDQEIKEQYSKGTANNLGCGWYSLKGLEVISYQLDELLKKFDQVLGDAENKEKIRKGCRLKAVSSRVVASIRGLSNL